MSLLEIIMGIVILVLSVVTVIVCLSQDQKPQDSMSAALTGASTDSFYGQHEGRSKEAILNKITRALSIILFIAVLVVNIIPLFTDK